MIPGWPIEEGPIEEGWLSLAALMTDRFDAAEAYFDLIAETEPGIDRRGQGAFFMGNVSYYYCFGIAWSVLHDRGVPNLTAAHVGFRPGEGRRPYYRVAEAPATDMPIGALVEATLAPLVERVKLATRLGDAAQWRLIADSVVGSLLAVGQHTAQAERAQDLGLSIVRDPRYRIFNGHTGVYEVEGRCFLKRGGCCRYYTAEAGSYCATCILRPPEEHVPEIRRRHFQAGA